MARRAGQEHDLADELLAGVVVGMGLAGKEELDRARSGQEPVQALGVAEEQERVWRECYLFALGKFGRGSLIATSVRWLAYAPCPSGLAAVSPLTT